jgi:hypothetical protein
MRLSAGGEVTDGFLKELKCNLARLADQIGKRLATQQKLLTLNQLELLN